MEDISILGIDIPFESVDGEILKLISELDKPERCYKLPIKCYLVDSYTLKQNLILPIYFLSDYKNILDAIYNKTDKQ